MIQQYKLEKKQPALFGPHKEIEFWRKMCIKFDRVCVLFKSKFVMFAETAMERTNSSLLKVNTITHIMYCRLHIYSLQFKRMLKGVDI